MRFEVASAKYGIFSDFYVGTIIDDAPLEEIFDNKRDCLAVPLF